MKKLEHNNLFNFLAKRIAWLFFPFIKDEIDGIKFNYKNKPYKYFFDKYNVTLCNERQIEVPIIRGEIPNMLEIGNVLQHYPCNWDIVDKYEKGRGVINCDISKFKPKKKYNLIVSISTLEHIGERTGQSKKKILKAINHLKSLLNKRGKLVFTVPLGWNSEMDELIYADKLGVKMRFMKLDKYYDWIECPMKDTENSEYGGKFPFANAIMVGEYVK